MTTPVTNGYLLECTCLATPVFFTAPKLLSARRAAMSHVETLLDQFWHQNDKTTNIQVTLVEASQESPASTARSIAHIYQRYHVDCVFCTSAETQQTIYLKALEELHEEFMHYLSHQQAMGLGRFQIAIHIEGSESTPLHTSIIIADALSYTSLLDADLNTWQRDPTLPERLTISTFAPMHHLRELSHQTS